jgi:hypothetical protein
MNNHFRISLKATNLPSSLFNISPELHYSNNSAKMNSNKMERNVFLITHARYTSTNVMGQTLSQLLKQMTVTSMPSIDIPQVLT